MCLLIVLFDDQVSVERGMSWNESLQLRRSYTHPADGYYLSHQVSRKHVLDHSRFSLIYDLHSLSTFIMCFFVSSFQIFIHVSFE